MPGEDLAKKRMKRKFLSVLLVVSVVLACTGCSNPLFNILSKGKDEQKKPVQEEVKDDYYDEEEIDEEDVDVDEKEDDKEEVKVENDGKEEVDANTNVDLSDNWTDMQIAIDGKVYNLPVDYDVLKADGWSFDLADYGKENGYILNPGDSVTSTIELTNPKYGEEFDSATLYVGFINVDDTAKDITECHIWSIKSDSYYGSRQMEKYPSVTVAKGIKFGSTEQEVIAAFGQPEEDDVYVSDSGYKTFEYCNDYSQYLRLTIYEDTGVSCIEIKEYQ